MRTLYLHIGSWKTGTTSIQKCMHSNAEKLLDSNIYYPQISEHHIFLTYLFNSNAESHIASRLENSPFQVQYEHAKTEWERISEMNNDVMLSSEFLLELSPCDIRRLYTILDKLFYKIKIIVYLREPVSHALSAVNEQVKCGHMNIDQAYSTLSRPEEIKQTLNWVSVFGKDKVTVREFFREKFYKQDLIQDFIKSLDINLEKAKLNQLVVENTSLSFESLTIASKICEINPGLSLSRLRSGFLHRIRGEHFIGNEAFRKAVKEYVKVDLKVLALECGVVFHEEKQYLTDEEFEKTVFSDDAIRSLAYLLNEMHEASFANDKYIKILEDCAHALQNIDPNLTAEIQDILVEFK